MTVSTISNVGADAQRALEKQNKQQDTKPVGTQPGSATLPVDQIADSALREVFTREQAVTATQVQNQEAAQAVLNDDDFPVSDVSAQEKVQAQAKDALKAQTSKLPANVLSLLVE